MSKVQRLISFFSREGSQQASAVPQASAVTEESSLKQTVRDPTFFDLKREAPDLITTKELSRQLLGENIQSFRNKPEYAHYFRGDEYEGLQTRAEIGGLTLERQEQKPTSFEFERPTEPKPEASPAASIQSAPQEFKNLPDDVIDSLKTPSEASRLGNTIEGSYKRNGFKIPSKGPRQTDSAPAVSAPAVSAPALPEPEATPSGSAPTGPLVSRNNVPLSAPTQAPLTVTPAEPISKIPDYAPLKGDDDEIQKVTTGVQGASIGAQTASRISKVATNVEEEEKAVQTAGKTVSGVSSFLAGSEGFVNPILDGIGLIGGLAGLIMGSGLFSKKPPAPPPVSIPKPPAIVIPTVSQAVGGGQI